MRVTSGIDTHNLHPLKGGTWIAGVALMDLWIFEADALRFRLISALPSLLLSCNHRSVETRRHLHE